MAKQNKIIKEVFTINVTAASSTVKASFEIDKNAETILGLAIGSSHPEIVMYRGSQSIKINDEEFFPEGYESNRLMCGQGVSPNARIYRIGKINPGNRKVEIAYTDSGNDDYSGFIPHKVFLYVYSKPISEVSESNG